MDDPLPVTRRRLLSFGTVGIGFLGVGTGTRNVLKPSEVEHNQVTVRQTENGDLIVEWQERYNGAIVEPVTGRSTENTPIVTIDNALPGDSGTISFRIYVADPGENAFDLQLRMQAPEGAFAENGITEPEAVAGDTGEPGELRDHLAVEAWYDQDGTFGSVDACNGVRDMGERFVDANPTGTTELVDGDSIGVVTSTTMLADWTQLDGQPASPDSVDCLPAGEEHAVCLGLAWAIPDDLPDFGDNVIQSDQAAFTIEFRIETCETNA